VPRQGNASVYESRRGDEMTQEDDDDIQAYVKPWVGLTDEEKKNIFFKWYGKHWAYTSQLQSVMDSVEAKLKEKNT
jgi:hypothetical protein